LKIVTFLVFLFLPFFGFGQHGPPISCKIQIFKSRSIERLIEKEIEYSLKELYNLKHLDNYKFYPDLRNYPTPDSMFNSAVSGDFVWSGYGITLSEYLNLIYFKKIPCKSSNKNKLIWESVKNFLLKDSKGSTFSQLNILKSLEVLNKDFPVDSFQRYQFWHLFKDKEKAAIREAGDVRKMYDPATKTILNGRPTNYFGVAASIATLSYKLGFEKDEKMVNDLLDHCVQLLEKNNGWLNDGKEGEFRFDRYHFEFIRFVWESAMRMNRKSLLAKIEPWCDRSDEIWLKLMHPVSGAPFSYGRSLQNTWEDVWEYGAFMLKRRSRNNVEEKEILAQIHKTWDYFYKNEFDKTRHIARMLDPGRACYSYVGPNRVWGYSIHALGKMLASINEIKQEKLWDIKPARKIKYIPESNYFSLKENYGLWIIRNKNTRITIPFVTGIGKPTNSDYQSIPFAEGISEPLVGMATTHLLPGIFKNGKMYLPKLSLTKAPYCYENNYFSGDSAHLSATKWISKSDTLPSDSSPVLKVVYYNKNQLFSMVYQLQNLENAQADSLVYSIWKSKWQGSPYEVGFQKPTWEIDAADFEKKECIHDLMKPEGRGAFTALPGRTDLVLKKPFGFQNWKVVLKYP